MSKLITMTQIQQATITQLEGTLYSPEFQDIYHSASGAWEQARLVFVEGNQLSERFRTLTHHTFGIFESGFGVGINFLATAEAWLKENTAKESHLHYVACEKHPVGLEDLSAALKDIPHLQALKDTLLHQWPMAIKGYHQIHFAKERIHLILIFDDIQEAVKELTMTIDALFLDGFSPQKNPAMWQADIFNRLSQHCHSQTTLGTWCVAGKVREALTNAGFAVQRVAGFGQKKQRLVGTFQLIPPEKQELRQKRFALHVKHNLHFKPPQRVAVVGAGIAGCLVSHALSARHINVDLYEAGPTLSPEASGNPAGILRPQISKDDNTLAQITRTGFFLAKQLIETLQPYSDKPIAQYPGVIHFAKDQQDVEHQLKMLQSLSFPERYVRYLAPQELVSRFGIESVKGGLFYPEAGFVHPPLWCQAAILAAGKALRLITHTPVGAVEHHDNQWLLKSTDGITLGSYDAVILTIGASTLAQTEPLGLHTNRGQLSIFASNPLPAGSPVLCDDGYLIPMDNKHIMVGASYDHVLDRAPWASSRAENKERAKRILHQPIITLKVDTERVAFRSVSRDRLPVVGKLTPNGLYCILANASRGLVWSALNAQIIASLITAEPLPVGQSLLKRLSPERLLMR